MREVKKVLIVTNVPQDYRIAMFNALHLLLQQENIQFKVAFGAAGYKRRKSNSISTNEIRLHNSEIN